MEDGLTTPGKDSSVRSTNMTSIPRIHSRQADCLVCLTLSGFAGTVTTLSPREFMEFVGIILAHGHHSLTGQVSIQSTTLTQEQGITIETKWSPPERLQT